MAPRSASVIVASDGHGIAVLCAASAGVSVEKARKMPMKFSFFQWPMPVW